MISIDETARRVSRHLEVSIFDRSQPWSITAVSRGSKLVPNEGTRRFSTTQLRRIQKVNRSAALFRNTTPQFSGLLKVCMQVLLVLLSGSAEALRRATVLRSYRQSNVGSAEQPKGYLIVDSCRSKHALATTTTHQHGHYFVEACTNIFGMARLLKC